MRPYAVLMDKSAFSIKFAKKKKKLHDFVVMAWEKTEPSACNKPYEQKLTSTVSGCYSFRVLMIKSYTFLNMTLHIY